MRIIFRFCLGGAVNEGLDLALATRYTKYYSVEPFTVPVEDQAAMSKKASTTLPPCRIHTKYKAINKPTAPCICCWSAWCKKNPGVTITTTELALILAAVQMHIVSVTGSVIRNAAEEFVEMLGGTT